MIQPTDELEQLARRMIWWQPPGSALQDHKRLLAQVMALGAWDDVQIARRHWPPEEWRDVLLHPPSGVFDKRSWSYWHRILGILPVPPLPQRKIA